MNLAVRRLASRHHHAQTSHFRDAHPQLHPPRWYRFAGRMVYPAPLHPLEGHHLRRRLTIGARIAGAGVHTGCVIVLYGIALAHG